MSLPRRAHQRNATDFATFTLLGQFLIAPLGRFPSVNSLPLGGISGLATTNTPNEVLGISDDKDGSRVFRFRLVGQGPSFRVDPVEYIPLQRPTEGPHELDPESIVLAPDGNLIVSSEGIGSREPRVPPALVEFGPHGEYLRQFEVRERFVPNPTGPLTKGVRSNFGFEALALTNDGDRLFTATETSLVQDGEVTTTEHGTPARLLEYVRRGDAYVPRREFVYPVEPVFKPPFEVGLAVNGLVDLLSLADGRLLAMERTYVEEAGQTGRSTNRIRLFQVDLSGASDVSSLESLRDAAGLTPVAKTAVLDLSDLQGLAPELAPRLDNFEGMTFGPRAPDGRATLILVSDDNFNPSQRTWFLVLAMGRSKSSQQIQ